MLQLLGAAAVGGGGAARLFAGNTPVLRVDEGRLTARPGRRIPQIDDGGSFLLHVPESNQPDRPMPLIVMLHGAGGQASRVLDNYRSRADEYGFILIAPQSHGTSWDVVRGEFGDDVLLIDRALDSVFSKHAVDMRHLAVAGFSDGASYALSLGITNGDLFSHIIAFSPGFAAAAARRGRPPIFIAHGTEDEILPIDRTSRPLVPRLEREGYSVHFEQFIGPHTVPRDIVKRALNWFLR